MEQGNPVIQLPSKSNNFLITLLSILLLISCIIAGFFAYQTQKLAKESTAYSVQIKQTRTPIAEPALDSTVGWKTYTNEIHSFSLKYPEPFEVLTDKKNLYGWEHALALFYGGGQSYDLAIEIWNSEAEYKQKYKSTNDNLTVHQTNNGKYLTLSNINNDPQINQVINTFTLNKACQEDAKICPDGSAVSRIAPDCKFAPCPN